MRTRLLSLVALLTLPLLAQAETPPNVLVIMADDLGYADMSFLPQAPKDVKTPGIDRIAATGTYFSNAYATAPICSPARAGFITGRYQQRWGNFWYGQGGLPASENTIAKSLRADGYFCQKIGKTHLNGGAAQHPLDHGFESFLGFIHHTWDYIRLSQKDVAAYKKRGKGTGILNVGPLTRDRDEKVSYENDFTTHIFTEEAVKTIKRCTQAKQPFYIQLEYNAVHMPTYVTDPAYARKAGYEQPAWDRDADSWEFPFWEPNKMGWSQWHKLWGHLGAVDPLGRKRYLANLMAMDDGIARLLDTLESVGQRDNTIVVFLSDNGGTINTYSNNTPLRGYKYMFGEGGIRVPIIVSYPGLSAPQRTTRDALVSTKDIYPTLLSLCKSADQPDNLDGRNLTPLLNQKTSTKGHDHLCWADGKGTWLIRQGPWKLIQSKGWQHTSYTLDDSGTAHEAPPIAYPKGLLLYNLSTDIGETTNLAQAHPDRVKTMTALYEKWRASMGKPGKPKP